jgi:hypothetical protein
MPDTTECVLTLRLDRRNPLVVLVPYACDADVRS